MVTLPLHISYRFDVILTPAEVDNSMKSDEICPLDLSQADLLLFFSAVSMGYG